MAPVPITRQAGLSLIEIVVAVGIFALLIGTATGIFVTITRAQRSATGQAALLGDAQTFLELLEREVRTGYGSTFRCAAACPGASFVFTNQEGEEVTFDLFENAIRRNGVALTARGVVVRDLEFVVTQSGVDVGSPPDQPLLVGEQGRVTVRVRACPPGVDDDRCLVTQTTLAARQYGPL